MHQIEFRPAAVRQLEAISSRAQRRRIVNGIERLGKDPRPSGARKLEGSKCTYRIRVGDYRVLYDLLDKKLVVLVVNIGHRREVYRRR